jgi:hypothetical protein
MVVCALVEEATLTANIKNKTAISAVMIANIWPFIIHFIFIGL